jgi:hypothetical protein
VVEREVRARVLAAAAACCAGLWVGQAQAAPLGRWCLSLERLFGVSWTQSGFEREYTGLDETTQTTVNVLASRAPPVGFSAPRLGLDYLTKLGLSFGGAVGFDMISRGGAVRADLDPNEIAVAVAPRVGYFFPLLPRFGLWPRAGLTYIALSRDADRRSVTLELPASLMLLEERVGVMLFPYVEAGVFEDERKSIGEVGVQVSVGLFL